MYIVCHKYLGGLRERFDGVSQNVLAQVANAFEAHTIEVEADDSPADLGKDTVFFLVYADEDIVFTIGDVTLSGVDSNAYVYQKGGTEVYYGCPPNSYIAVSSPAGP